MPEAGWLGIKVVQVSENNTSKLCHRCGNRGIRKGGLFKCPHCNYTGNADYNGAMNIMKRAWAICLRQGLA
ncbi:MAG: transposase [Candidatus Brockarchaeota archaeon]|nr:transposase [Candidatus Brockarchaeota archaeon]